MASTLPISRVVNVTVNLGATAAATRNFGAMCVIGASNVIDATERIRAYSSIAEVAADFGTAAPEYAAAAVFFGQSPTPSILYIGRWVQTGSSALLRGRILATDEQDISNFTDITAGTLSLSIGGQAVNLTAIDLSEATNLNGVASAIADKLGANGSCVWNGSRFVISTATTGSSATISATVTGTLADPLGMDADSNPTVVAGADAETIADGVATLLDFPAWYGATIAADLSAAQILSVAALIEAASPSRILAVTSQDTNDTDSSVVTGIGTQLHEKGYNRTTCIYSSDEPYAAAAILGRIATVNFNGSNTTITLKFKQAAGVSPEYLRTSQANALKDRDINVFAAYNNDTAILQEGTMSGGWFVDERHGLDWLQDYLQTALYNLLYTSGTKIGQDESGINQLISTCEKAMNQAVVNGLCAAGVWNGDEFGALRKGDTLTKGYYIYVQPLAEQAQADREARKAPAIQIGAKLKGAVHFVDVSLIINR